MRQASRRVVKFPNVEVVHATPRAVLCTIAAVEFWVPRSQIHLSSEVQHPGDVGVLVVSRWWADISGAAEAQNSPLPALVDTLPNATRLYKRLIFELHPDRNPGSEVAARAINQLWQAVISDLRGA
jgi:hypothetical protein